eukprot:9098655-Pyramimonas_sp.AAC.2
MKEVKCIGDDEYEYALVFQFAAKDKTRTEVLKRCEEVFHAHGVRTHVVADALSGSRHTVKSFLLLQITFKRLMVLAQRDKMRVELQNGLFEAFVPGRMHEYKYANDPRKLIQPVFVHDVISDILQSATGPRDGISVVTSQGASNKPNQFGTTYGRVSTDTKRYCSTLSPRKVSPHGTHIANAPSLRKFLLTRPGCDRIPIAIHHQCSTSSQERLSNP